VLSEHELIVVAAAGSGDRAPVEAEVRRCGLAERVRFHERVTDERLRALYRGADVLVFPSFAEGFGLPPLEAMACGAPVIVSSLPAHREVLGDAAQYVEPADAASLAEAMLRVAGDPALSARMSELGRRQAERYPVDAFVRKTLDVYRAAASRLWESTPGEALVPGRTGGH
jgi:glycosyltransferase involved in cell wall biosynthesis